MCDEERGWLVPMRLRHGAPKVCFKVMSLLPSPAFARIFFVEKTQKRKNIK
jgi:hypothetical protein